MNQLARDLPSQNLIGNSPAFYKEMKKVHLTARCDSSVLIYGETGTGKELCARQIHALGLRAGKPFVPINCGAIPVELAENELFGHEPGAFTGAAAIKPGLIHEAQGGTLFLDEIDSLPLLMQVKLLRFLQEKTYRPLGSTKEHRADVRVIAATNISPEEAVKSGRLRQDLYYRLNVISIRMPALRERRDDIPVLALHFLEKHGVERQGHVPRLCPKAIRALMSHDWPGNVRELEHVIERAIALCTKAKIRAADISLPRTDASESEESFNEAKRRVVEEFEKSYILRLLQIHRGNISRAAETARKNRRAFWELIRKHRIDVSPYKGS